MDLSYKDLTYIRAAIQSYETSLSQVGEGECDEDEFSENQDDILYLGRLLALVNKEIDAAESSALP